MLLSDVGLEILSLLEMYLISFVSNDSQEDNTNLIVTLNVN